MFEIFKKLFNQEKELNKIYIYKKEILSNLENLEKFQPKADFFPVLKSNAYWHWVENILKIIKWKNFPYLCVDDLEDYKKILENSKFNILYFWKNFKNEIENFDLKRTTFCVYDLETLRFLIKLKKKIKIHLFLKTGNEWLWKDDLQTAVFLILWTKIEVEWTMSHFKNARTYSFKDPVNQIITFKKLNFIVEKAFKIKYKHLWASAGIFRLHDEYFNAFRPGLIIYWYNPLDFWIKWESNQFHPAMKIETTITNLQTVKAKEKVDDVEMIQDRVIWTLAFWYKEWLFQILTKRLKFKYKEKFISQVWVISPHSSNFYANDKMKIWEKVEIISPDILAKNFIWKLAKKSQVSIYEILKNIDKSIKRVIK